MKLWKILMIACTVLSFAACDQAAPAVTTPDTPEEALAALLEGNLRFVGAKPIHPHADAERVTETAPHQEPFAAVVGCSDSRVPVELIFDRGIGDLFVIRTAGNNVAGEMVTGSVEYAVDHLGVKVLLVLGHGSCGGVTSAITPGEHSGAVGHLLHHIQASIPDFVGKPDALDQAIEAHTRAQVEALLQNPIVAERVAQGKLLVQGAHYDIHTGKVTLRPVTAE